MAAEWCDGFLQLVKSGQPRQRRDTDKDYPGAIEILSFKIGSMSGFTDDAEGFYAVQNVSERRGVAASRAQAKRRSQGIASLFGGDESTPEYSETSQRKARQRPFGSRGVQVSVHQGNGHSRRPICFEPIAALRIWRTATFSIRRRLRFASRPAGARSAFLTYVFKDLVVVGYSLEIGGDASPKETIKMSFAKIRAEYKPQKTSGVLAPVVKGGWDFIERTSW